MNREIVQRGGLATVVSSLAVPFSTNAHAQDGTGLADDGTTVVVVLGFYGVVLIVGLIIYVLPSIVAFKRQHPNRWIILAINLALGGTGIAWLGSLVWAFNAVHKSPTGSDGGESGINLFANDPVIVRTERAPSTRSIAESVDLLERVNDLLAKGLISQDEHGSMRRAALDEIMR
ncbi:superinfection immunity protein [Devosia sp.]|uniref:superinfection immunity protein n=1 Tax=Devosia sp. TaxID=1871048 RepID=UPI003264A3AF